MISQQKKPTNKFQDFMANFGSNALGSLVSGLLLIGATALLARIHFLSFNWLILMILLQNIVIAFFVGYCLRTRRKLQAKQQDDAAALREELKVELTEALQKEHLDWNKSFYDHAGAHEEQKKEQNERLEKVKKQLDERIDDINRNLSTRIQSNWNSTTEWQNAHNVAHGKEQQS